MSETALVNGEPVEMTETERTDLGLVPAEEAGVLGGTLTIRIFRSRFGESDADLDLYDELDARLEAERSRLVKQQWRDPGAEIVEGGALHSTIAAHLDALAPERKGEFLARA